MRRREQENSEWFGPEIPRSQEALGECYDFWAGRDAQIEPMIAQPGVIHPDARLTLSRENFPPIPEFSLSTIHLLRRSMRSCYAQVGIEVFPKIDELTPDDIERIKNGEQIICHAEVLNHSRRAVELGDGVFRFFWLNPTRHLIKEKLAKAVHSKIKIEGEEGKDWFLSEAGQEAETITMGAIKSGEPLTLAFRIKDQRLWIPFPATEHPIRVSGKEDLSRYLESVPPGLDPEFQIGETVKVVFPDDLVGTVVTGVRDESSERQSGLWHSRLPRHLSSPLIDPGFSGPIRLELEQAPRHPSFVELLIYEKTR